MQIYAYHCHMDRKLSKHEGMDTKAPNYAAKEHKPGEIRNLHMGNVLGK